MGRDLDLTDNGAVIFREDVANGVAAVTVDAPADLTGAGGSYAMELLDALPASEQFLKINAAGKWTTNPGASGTLDAAYDSGGPGAGRVINANAGPVEVNGQGILLAPTSRIVWETDVASFNYRTIAQLNRFDIQFGSQDADASDDVFNTFLTLSKDSGDNRIGLNTNTPSDLLHLIESGSGAARIRLQTNVAAVDVSIMFLEQTTARWEIGYDDSEGGFVIGRLSFANPVLFVEDTTGLVGIGTVAPTAKLSIFSNIAGQVALFLDQDNATGRGLVIDSEATSQPLVEFLPLTGNSRGDIAFGTARLADPSAPAEADIWYNAGDETLNFQTSAITLGLPGQFTALRFGPTAIATIDGSKNITITRGHQVVAAGVGVADFLDGIIHPNAKVGDVLILVADGGDSITIRDGVVPSGGADSIRLEAGTDRLLFNNGTMCLRYNGTKWIQWVPIFAVPL